MPISKPCNGCWCCGITGAPATIWGTYAFTVLTGFQGYADCSGILPPVGVMTELCQYIDGLTFEMPRIASYKAGCNRWRVQTCSTPTGHAAFSFAGRIIAAYRPTLSTLLTSVCSGVTTNIQGAYTLPVTTYDPFTACLPSGCLEYAYLLTPTAYLMTRSGSNGPTGATLTNGYPSDHKCFWVWRTHVEKWARCPGNTCYTLSAANCFEQLNVTEEFTDRDCCGHFSGTQVSRRIDSITLCNFVDPLTNSNLTWTNTTGSLVDCDKAFATGGCIFTVSATCTDPGP